MRHCMIYVTYVRNKHRSEFKTLMVGDLNQLGSLMLRWSTIFKVTCAYYARR